MSFSFYTDLAWERQRASEELGGCRYKEEALGLCRLHTLHVDTEECGAALGCSVGCYRTLFFPSAATLGSKEIQEVTFHLADLLRQTKLPHPKRVLVVGLGNRAVTADSLGPQVAGGVHATAHLKEEAPHIFSALDSAEIAVFVPDVTANSGLATSPLVAAVAELFSPDLVIAVDSLAAHGIERLGRTVQITDAGITPGAGVGNNKMALCQEDLPCPLLSIGAPTVCTPATLLHKASRSFSEEELEDLCKETAHLFLSPQDADLTTKRLAEVIAGAINRAFGVADL
jgi:spore protease